jgi:hypothetical protein
VGVHVAGGDAQARRAARRAPPAAGCGRGRRAGTGAAARSAGDRRPNASRRRRSVGSSWTRVARSRSGRPGPRRARGPRFRARAGPVAGAPTRPSRVCACARVRSRQRFDHPRRPGPAGSGGVRRRGRARPRGSGAAPAPWRDGELHRARDRVVVGQRQRLVAELQRGGTSSSGSEAPSRNENAEWQWSSTYTRLIGLVDQWLLSNTGADTPEDRGTWFDFGLQPERPRDAPPRHRGVGFLVPQPNTQGMSLTIAAAMGVEELSVNCDWVTELAKQPRPARPAWRSGIVGSSQAHA